MTFASRLSLAALLCVTAAPLTAQAPTAQSPGALVEVAKAALTIPPEVRVYRIGSAYLRETRQVRVVLPPSHANTGPDRRYPVIVVFDGESLTSIVHDVGSELLKHGQVPEAIIVGIDNFGPDGRLDGGMKRVFDLTPPGLSVAGSDLQQGGDRMLDFIERELLPAIDRQFRAGEPRILVGHSSGGVLATYAAATRPALRIAISLDAPINLEQNWLAERLITRTGFNERPVRYASLDARFGWPDERWAALTAKAPTSWRLSRQALAGEGHETMTMVGTYIGLRDVFADYSRLAAPALTADSVLAYYARISESLGAPVPPPRRVLDQIFDRSFDEHKIPAAKRVWAAIIAGYGRPSNAARMEGRIAQAERAPPPAETVDGLLATPFPTPEQAGAYIGEWIGDIWPGENAQRQNAVRLRVRVEGGKVIGETIRRGPQGEVVRRWEYLRITANVMTWGAMNGMEPRGVALFEGVLKGDELAGRMRIAGLAPGTDTGPPLHFAFTRVKP